MTKVRIVVVMVVVVMTTSMFATGPQGRNLSVVTVVRRVMVRRGAEW